MNAYLKYLEKKGKIFQDEFGNWFNSTGGSPYFVGDTVSETQAFNDPGTNSAGYDANPGGPGAYAKYMEQQTEATHQQMQKYFSQKPASSSPSQVSSSQTASPSPQNSVSEQTATITPSPSASAQPLRRSPMEETPGSMTPFDDSNFKPQQVSPEVGKAGKIPRPKTRESYKWGKTTTAIGPGHQPAKTNAPRSLQTHTMLPVKKAPTPLEVFIRDAKDGDYD